MIRISLQEDGSVKLTQLLKKDNPTHNIFYKILGKK